MPQDEWITDPQDERLANLPEWVPRPGETATVEWDHTQLPVEATVKAVRTRTDGSVDLDIGGKDGMIPYVYPNAVLSIGDRYRHSDYRG